MYYVMAALCTVEKFMRDLENEKLNTIME